MDIKTFCVGENRINTNTLSMSFVMFTVGNMLFFSIPFNTCIKGFGYVWYALGCLLAMYLIWSSCSSNEYYYSLKFPEILTIPSYFEVRFSQKNHILKFIISGIAVFVSGVLLACMINILEKVIVNIFGFESEYVLLFLVAITLYVINFGFEGIQKLNIFRFIVLSAAILFFVIIIIILKGPEGILMGIFYSSPPGGMTNFLDVSVMSGYDMTLPDCIDLFSKGILIIGNAAVFVLFLCFSNPVGIRRSRGLSFIISLLLISMGFLEGAFIRAFMANNFAKDQNIDQITLYKSFFTLLMKGEWAYKISGILLSVSAVLCIMAIIEVSLYIILGILFNDIFRELPISDRLIYTEKVKIASEEEKEDSKNKDGKEEEREVIAKKYKYLSGFLIIIAAYLWSYNISKPVALAGGALILNFCTIGIALMDSFVRKKACARSCVIGMIVALVCLLFWEKYHFMNSGADMITLHEFFGFNGILPSVVVAEVFMALVSIFVPGAGKKAEQTFMEVKNHMT